jgi:hypothetical protein
MWNRIIRFAVVSLVFLWACSKEDEPVTASLSGTPEITVTTLRLMIDDFWKLINI